MKSHDVSFDDALFSLVGALLSSAITENFERSMKGGRELSILLWGWRHFVGKALGGLGLKRCINCKSTRAVSFGGILVVGTITNKSPFLGDEINDNFECIKVVHGFFLAERVDFLNSICKIHPQNTDLDE